MKIKLNYLFLIIFILFLNKNSFAVPQIDSITPDYGFDTTDTGITLIGKNFDSTCRVYIGSNGPYIKGVIDTPGAGYRVNVSGNYAYVTNGSAGLQIVDISNPSNPILAGSIDTPYEASGICVVKKYAYIADGVTGLQVVDISNPSDPVIRKNVDTPGYAGGVYVVGNYAYIADNTAGLQIMDISNPLSSNLISSIDTPGYANGIYISGNYAYVADGNSGLQIINIETPTNPYVVGGLNISKDAIKVYVLENYVYVSDGAYGLQMIDISNPTNPKNVWSVDASDKTYAVYAQEKKIYIVNSNTGFITNIDAELQIFNRLNIVTTILKSNFADENTISTITPQGLFPGKYNIKISNSQKEESMLYYGFMITQQLPNQIPLVTLIADKTEGTAPLTVIFAADASDSDGNIIKYEWDLDGDGNYELDSGINNTVSHTYSSSKKYEIKVRVTDNDNATEEKSI